MATANLTRRPQARWLAALLLAALIRPEVGAHETQRARFVQLHLGRDQVRVEVYLTVAQGTLASDLRQRFDADADGRLAAHESQSLADYAQRHLMDWPRVTVGETDLVWTLNQVASRGLDDPAASNYPIELRFSATAACPKLGPQAAVTIRDADARFRTPVGYQVSPPAGYRVTLAEPGERVPSTAPLRLEFRDSGDTVVILLETDS